MLVAGAMLEHHLREIFGDFDALVHVAVGGRENDVVALLREVLEDRNGARVLLDVLDVVGGHLAVERGDHRLAALVVRPGPAEIADGSEIDECGLERVGGESAPPRAGSAKPAAAAVLTKLRRVIKPTISLLLLGPSGRSEDWQSY